MFRAEWNNGLWLHAGWVSGDTVEFNLVLPSYYGWGSWLFFEITLGKLRFSFGKS